jgi:hypothetical protein
MSTLSLRLPVSLHRKLSDLAENEGVSLNQLISSAAAEKVAALMTQEYLLNRAGRASRDKFDAVLARVPKVSPVAGDEVPAAYLKRPHRKGGQPIRPLKRIVGRRRPPTA